MPQQELALSVERRFLLELSGVPKDAQRRAARVLESIRTSSAGDIKALAGHDRVYRARCGDYRILFAQGDRWVHVYSIQHRQGVYTGAIATPRFVPGTTVEDFPELDLPAAAVPSPSHLPYSRHQLAGFGFSPEQIAALIEWDGSLDGLEHLSATDIPDFLTDSLLQKLADDDTDARSRPPQDVQLITNKVLDSFFAPLLRGLRTDHPIEELIIVSPWITPWESAYSSLRGLCNFIRRCNVRTYVITRPPELASHARAVEQLQALRTTEVTFLDTLHAKYYVCDMPPSPLALVSSANSTRASFSNTEVGVLVHGRAALEGFVRDLQELTTELRGASRSGSHLVASERTSR